MTRAVARPIGWLRSQVVERSMTPSLVPVTGSWTGAAQQTQLCTIGRVVLGAEDHRRGREPVGQVQGVGADRLLVPPAAGHEVHALGLAAHDAPAVGPQHPGVGVGDRDDQVAVQGRLAQLRLDPLDRGLQRRVPPDGGDLRLVGERCLLDVRRDGGPAAGPAAEDLGADDGLGGVAVLDEAGPRPDGVNASGAQLGAGHEAERSPTPVTPVTGPVTRPGAAAGTAASVHRVLPAGVEGVVLARLPLQPAVDPGAAHQPLGGARPRRRAGAVDAPVEGQHRLGDPVEVRARRELA